MLQSKAMPAAAVAGALFAVALAMPVVHAADDPDLTYLKKSQSALLSRKYYRAVSETTDDSGKTTERTIEVVPPKSYHMKSDRMEMIILPDASYQLTHGHWMRFPMDMSKMLGDVQGKIFDESAEHITIKPLGFAVWEGTPSKLFAVGYSYKGITSDGKVWIRASDNLPLHTESNIDSPKHSFMGRSTGGKMKSVTTYDYTTPVTITAPDVK